MAGGYNNHNWDNGKRPYNQKNDHGNRNKYEKRDDKLVVENFIPIPNDTKDLLKTSKTVNFGLYSPRMTELGSDWKASKNNIPDLLIKSKSLYGNIESLINKKNKVLNSYLATAKKNGYIVYEKTMYTKTPFITGLGSGHPTETGMILDRNLGVPYIPASSVKGGCLLAYAINIAKKGMADENGNITLKGMEKIEELFGTQDENAKEKKRGQLVFLDAFPDAIPKLTVDIMNPHFQKYYNGERTKPLENEDPVPINFLVVSEGCGFTFRCLYKLSENEKKEDIEKDIEAFFETAFTEVGFGGKTAVGYGRFQNEKIQKRPQIQQ